VYRFTLWIHILAVISWMAGILYLYRILIYHAERGQKSRDNHELLSVMARKLYRFITVPAMIVTWVAGLCMIALQPALANQGWFHVKFFAVVLLTGATQYAGRLARKFAASEPGLPAGKRLRILNEVPTLLMIIITAMVIFKPWA